MNRSRYLRRRGSRNATQLTDLEHSILLAVRRKRIATVQEIRRELNWAGDSVPIRAALLRLEERKFIVHSIELGQFFYRHEGSPERTPDISDDSAAA